MACAGYRNGCNCYKCQKRAVREAFYDKPSVVPESEAGYGTVGGRSVYYDTNPDGSTNVFPGGRPHGRHTETPHEHMVVNEDGGVEYWRTKEGDVLNNYRDYHSRD